MNEIIKRTIFEHAEALASKEYSAEELTRAYLDRIEECNGEINAFITVTSDEAIRSAKESDERRKNGKTIGILDGIPLAIKDNICTAGIRTTCASKMLSEYVPPYTATAASRLLDGGSVLLGKANMDEFAMGSTTESSFFGATKNPLDTSLSPGGSSGGSAASVAAFMTAGALGSDTGGSLRQPAAFCGAVAMKPTYSRVSRYGLVAFASSFDTIGAITKDVRDNALILSAISGKDARDSTSVSSSSDLSIDIDKPIGGITIGLPRELFSDSISADVRAAVMHSAEIYKSLGAKITEISLPSLNDALAAYYIISSAEASSNLARFDGIRYGFRSKSTESIDELYTATRSEGFGDEVKRRIILGTFALREGCYDEYYLRAKRISSRVRAEMLATFEKCDVILSPVSPTTAYKLGVKRDNPTDIWADDICTVPASISGLPALSRPSGRDKSGMPLGVQLMGRDFSEPLLYRVGYALEMARRCDQ